MVPCNLCQTPNSLDSRFCKQCGADLPDDDLREARSNFSRTVSQGYILFNEGKIEQAMIVAQQTTVQDPSSAEALSLKAMCHERLGNVAEALECYERVVELNPDSTLDRMKVNQLRNMIAGEVTRVPEPNQKLALIGGAAAVAFVLMVGSITAIIVNRNREAPRSADLAMNTQPASTVGAFQAPAPAPAASSPSPSAPPDNTAATSVPDPAQAVQNTPTVPLQPTMPDPAILPKPEANATNQSSPSPDFLQGPFQVKPVDPKVTPDTIDPMKVPDPDPSTVSQPTQQSDTQNSDDDAGTIEITVSKPPKKTIGGSESVASQEGLAALLRAANAEFQLRKYDSAAKAFEHVLQAGGDVGFTSQRLGQCYENLNRKDEAIAAYQRAVAGFESSIAAGKGSLPREKAALDTCQQAIQVLQGN